MDYVKQRLKDKPNSVVRVGARIPNCTLRGTTSLT